MATHAAEIVQSAVIASTEGLDIVDVKYKFLGVRPRGSKVLSSPSVIQKAAIAAASSGRAGVPAKPGREVAAITKVRTSSSVYALLVATFKPAVGFFCLELPAGPVLPHETADDAAVRVVRELTNCPASTSNGVNASSWLPLYADLCPNCAILIELAASFQGDVPPVATATTQGGEPIHLVHVPLHQFLESATQIAVNHGFKMSSLVYALGFKLSGGDFTANMFQSTPATAVSAIGEAMVGAHAGAPLAALGSGDLASPGVDINRIKRVAIGIVLGAVTWCLASSRKAARKRKEEEARKRRGIFSRIK